MIKKVAIILITTLALSVNVNAASDGELLLKKNKPSEVKDCFEGLNRATFALNQGLDKIIFKPIAQGYRKLPSPVREGTSNVLDNLSNLITIPNNVLQGDFKMAGTNSARLVVNSTLGILGIFDIAEFLGFPEYVKEDYGQTLGSWGIGPGCYMVLPVLGPTTVRDTAGMFMNVMGGDPYYNISVNGNNEYLDGELYAATKMLSGIDFRAKNIESIDNLAIHTIHGSSSGAGWERPKDEIYLSKRARLTIRSLNKHIELIKELDNKTLPVGKYSVKLSKPNVKKLTVSDTLFCRYLIMDISKTEDQFLESVKSDIEKLGIHVKKMMCGKSYNVKTSKTTYKTCTLLITEMSPQDSIKLQEIGLGIGKLFGCGIFLPYKSIAAVAVAKERDE